MDDNTWCPFPQRARRLLAAALALAAFSLGLPQAGAMAIGGCDLYVATSGSDTALGTAAAPFATVQHLVDQLEPGKTGCLEAGARFEENVTFARTSGGTTYGGSGRDGAPVVLTSSPGPRATLAGRLWISSDADHVIVSDLNLDGRNPNNLPGPTINGDHVTFTGNEVTNNIACFTAGSLDEHGPAVDVTITGNAIHDCGEITENAQHSAINLVRSRGAVISDNYIYSIGGKGIILYPDPQETLIEHNVIYGTHAGINFGGDCYNNGLDCYAPGGTVIRDNIITNSDTSNVESWYPETIPPSERDRNNVVTENCVFAPGQWFPNFELTHGGYEESDNVVADPLYIDETGADFRVAPSSPCADKGPRSLVTRVATEIGSQSALVWGDVPHDAMEVWFEYGANDAYGSTTMEEPVRAIGTLPYIAAAWIRGLQKGTTYHYRVAALTPSGIVTGAGMTFTTAGGVPECLGRTATVVGSVGDSTIVGTPGEDVIVGTAGPDVIKSGAGNDVVCALGGDDVVLTARGSDIVAGGVGNDTLSGGPGRDKLLGETGEDDVLNGGPGNDILNGGTDVGGRTPLSNDVADYSGARLAVAVDLDTGRASGGYGNDVLKGIESIRGSRGNDRLTGDNGINTIGGGPGDDVITGKGGRDFVDHSRASAAVSVNLAIDRATGEGRDTLRTIESIIGSPFDDLLQGDDDVNEIDAGPGDDTIFAGDGVDEVFAGDGSDDVYGGPGDDVLHGGAGDDLVDGGPQDDVLLGDAESDPDAPGADAQLVVGNDSLNGGAGTDLVSYEAAPGSVHVDLMAGTAVGEGTDALTRIEDVFASKWPDVIVGDDQSNFFAVDVDDDADGRGGFDLVTYHHVDLNRTSVAVDLVAGTVTGTDRNGDVVTSSLTDIEGAEGTWSADVLRGDDAMNLLIGGGSADELHGLGGDDFFIGGDLTAEQATTVSFGDHIFGGGGSNDTISYYFAHRGVDLRLATGTGLPRGIGEGGAADTLSGVESAEGSKHQDILTGDANRNVLFGEGDADVLSGNGGDDALDGGAGTDSLDGGVGTDSCINHETAVNCETTASAPRHELSFAADHELEERLSKLRFKKLRFKKLRFK